jgi:hypothetical protein
MALAILCMGIGCAGAATADDGFWDLPEQLMAEEGRAADLYAAASFPRKERKEPKEPEGAGRIITMCGGCFDARKLRSSLDPASPEHALLTFIGSQEGPRGYDDFFRLANPAPPRPLTTMKVREVRDWQRQAANRANYRRGTPVSSAAGRYQIVSGTMDHLISSLGLTGEEVFDEKLQDAMALWLLAEAGWEEFKGGRVSVPTFGNAVARIWAALPALSGPKKGRSWYHAFNGNRATVGAGQFHDVLSGLRKTSDKADRVVLAEAEIATRGVTTSARNASGPR